MATVLLLRHGRTTTNADGTLAGRRPVELDEVGRAQVRALRDRLAASALPLATVVCSPLLRCRQTIELALPGGPATVDDRLTECGYGDWTGQPLSQLAKHALWRVVQDHPSAVTFPGAGGEAMADMAARAVAAVRSWDADVARRHGPDAVWLACSHGDVIKAVVADALGMHLDLFQRVTVAPASITAIRYTPLRPFLLRLNDTGGDLGGLAPTPAPTSTPGSRSAGCDPDRTGSLDAGSGGAGASDAVLGGGAGDGGRCR
jgi:probable phosphomutase (TIGR03848 family)